MYVENDSYFKKEKIKSSYEESLHTSENLNKHNETLKLFQPKLLKLKHVNTNSLTGNNTVPNNFYKKENANNIPRIKKNTVDIAGGEYGINRKKIDECENNIHLKNKVLSFYKNPFAYLDYLIEKYFREKLTGDECTQIKERICKDMLVHKNNSQEEIKSLLESEIKKLQKNFRKDFTKALEKIKVEAGNVESKANLDGEKIIRIIEEKFSEIQKAAADKNKEIVLRPKEIKINEPNLEIYSQPIDMNQEEIFEKIFNKNPITNFFPEFELSTDIKNTILNNKNSELSANKILTKAMECIKGDRIEIPTRNFIEVKNLTLNDLNPAQTTYSHNILHRMRELDSFKKQNEDEILNQINKTADNEKKIFENLISRTNQSINQMEKHKLISEELIDKIKENVDTEFNESLIMMSLGRLKFHDKNLDKIQQDLVDKNEENIASTAERIRMIEENNRRVDEEIEKLLGKEKEVKEKSDSSMISDKMINQLYNKFVKKKTKGSNLFNPKSVKKIIRPVISKMTNFK